MTAENTGELEIERHDATLLLRLNRPEALNALSYPQVDALKSALTEAGQDRSVRAVVLSAAGDRAFCAGIDVKSVAERDAAAEKVASTGTRLDPVVASFESLDAVLGDVVRLIHRLPVPVIAAVNGHAIGAGFAYAAACDLRVGSSNAKFADGFVKRGISGCELGLSYFLPKIIGPALAFEMMMTGRTMAADEAKAAGLISEVVEPHELETTALAQAERIATLAPLSVTMTKEVMWANLHASSLDHALAMEARTQGLARLTADAAEARNSFIEKRTPEFAQPEAPRPFR